jgi:hypothetical protein
MEESSLTEYAKLLTDVLEIWDVLLDHWITPAPGSPAEGELQAARRQPSQAGAWGEEPVHRAYGLALMQFHAALEHGKAMVALMTGEFTAVPVVALTRALVEVAGQAWWLLESGIGHVGRVERLQVLRFRNAVEGQRSADADGVPEAAYEGYTETTALVEAYSRRLGIPVPAWSKPDRTYVCGSAKLPSATSLVRGLFDKVDVPSVYNLYSGYAHGHPFALWRDYAEEVADGALRYRPLVNEESFKGAVAMASYALYPPAERLSALLGLLAGRMPEGEPGALTG